MSMRKGHQSSKQTMLKNHKEAWQHHEKRRRTRTTTVLDHLFTLLMQRGGLSENLVWQGTPRHLW